MWWFSKNEIYMFDCGITYEQIVIYFNYKLFMLFLCNVYIMFCAVYTL